MLRRLSPRERFEALVNEWETKVRAAFISAVQDIRSQVVLRRFVERLERQDIEGALQLLNIDEGAYGPLVEQIRQAFNAGGIAEVDGMPLLRDPEGHRVYVRFDVRNLNAEAWLSAHAARLARELSEDQRRSIRTALYESLARGDNPTRSATSIVGRVNRVTGRREGGIIGLTSAQAAYVATARRELASGDPVSIRNYLERARRDKRFDKAILAALKQGGALDQVSIEKIVGRYEAGLLKLRSDTLALNETMAALSASKDQAWQQQIDAGKVEADLVTKTWRHTPQEKPRAQHVAMNGQEVGFEDAFVAPDGTRLRFPHDPDAPARHLLGCKCIHMVKVNYVEALVRRQRPN